LQSWLGKQGDNKVDDVLSVYRKCGIDQWALSLKNKFLDEALADLDQIAVVSARKKPLIELAEYLIKRDV
jgi:geranylgeranyl diphosphate synthase type II